MHIVGDLHQPLHVGNGKDRGGNDVKLDFFWESSNLHRIWDSGIIDQQKLSYTEYSDLLIDAGCEYQGYAADITRTFPINGRFSPEQRAIYNVVLKSQLAAIAATKPGKKWNHPHDVTVKMITQGLIDLGLLSGNLNDLIESGAYTDFYMHRAGHWLGLDVHGVGDYRINGKWRPLEPGMVLTIEPGIYVAADNMTVDPKWRGIGVRIEDDVVVTQSGCHVLTSGVPKDADEIEALMAAA